MLDFTVTQHPFRFGLAEGTDPNQVPPGTLTTAENVEWQKSGRVQKRSGTTTLTKNVLGGGTIQTASRLFTRGGELCLIDGTSLYAYSAGSTVWKNIGKVPNLGLTLSTVNDTPAGTSSADCAVASNGDLVQAWVSGDPTPVSPSGGLYIQITSATGAALLPPTLLFSATSWFGLRVMIIGTTAVVVSLLRSTTTFRAFSFDLTTYTQINASTGTALRADWTATGTAPNGGWDACVVGSNFVLAYNAPGPTVKLYSYNTSFVQQATGGVTGEANGCSAIAIDATVAESIYVLYCTTVAVPKPIRIATCDPSTLAQVSAPATIETPPGAGYATHVGVCRYDASNCAAVYRMYDNALGVGRTVSCRVSNAAVVDTDSFRGTWWGVPLSRPFMVNSRCYLTMLDASTAPLNKSFTNNSALVELEVSSKAPWANYVPHRYVGKIEALIAGIWAQAAPLPNVTSLSSSYYMTQPFQSSVTTGGLSSTLNWRQGVRLLQVGDGAALPTDMFRAVTVGQESYIAGSGLTAYDGASAFSYGFERAPFVQALTTNAAGGSIAAGTYLYGAVEEYRSNAGVLHRSPTATGASIVTTGATSTNTLVVAGYNLAAKSTLTSGFGVTNPLASLIPIYRTTVGGTVYQRFTYEPGFNVLLADETVVSSTLTDIRSDNSIDGLGTKLATRPAIYTTGGILDDEQPPAARTMFHSVDRLWILAPDQRTWWYSKAFQDDTGVAPGFTPSFRIVFDDTQTAGVTMDDKSIFFSAAGIKYLLGTGPAPSGQNSDFQTPITIQTDVGCTNARSVVSMPDGIMFVCGTDVYLLTRGLQIEWIGRPVKDTLALFPVVTSAVLVATRNQVRFTCNKANGTEGIVFVYDYIERQWSTFRHGQGVAGAVGFPYVDACMWNGAWVFVTGAQVYVESDSTYLDGSTWVPITLETAWISGPQSSVSPSSGPLKFQSVRSFQLDGISNTDHDLTVSCGFDGSASYPQIVTFAATSAATAVPLEGCEVTIGTRRKCGAIRFKIIDASPSSPGVIGTGQGPSFGMMGLEVGNKRGMTSNPATKKG